MKRAIAAATLCVGLLAVGPLVDMARTEPEPPADVMRLASQTPWVGRAGEFALRLLVATDHARDLEVAVTVYQRIVTRSDFELTLTDTVRGSPITVAAAPLSDLTPDPGGAVTVRLPIQDPSLPRGGGRVALGREGVYPVRVELRERDGGAVSAKFTTHLVYVPEPLEGSKLGFAWVVPLHAPPSFAPDGTRTISPPQLTRLTTLTHALAAHAKVPVVLRPTPDTIDAVAAGTRPEEQDVVASLKRAVAGRQVLPETFVPVHLPAMLDAGLTDELATQRTRGAEVLAATVQQRPDPRTWVFDEHLDDDALAALRRDQIDRIVVDDRSLDPSPLPVTLAQPFTLEERSSGRRKIDAIAADSGLAAHFDPTPDPVLAGHQLLADLAVVHFDRPGRPRIVTAVPPRTWRADARFLEVVLSGLATSPVVAGTTLDAAFNGVPDATVGNRPLVRRLVPANTRTPSMPARALRAARRDLDSFNTILDPGNPVFENLDRRLLVGESTEVRSSLRDDYTSGVEKSLRAELARVQMPGNRVITLTARQGEIPVTIRNLLGYPIHARLRVESDKLDFPGGGDSRVLTLERQNTTERFAVSARVSGAFPLRVVLVSEDGRLELGRSLFTVRSTAASGVGVILSVGAGVFLLLWWARHFARSRRSSRAEALPTS